MTIALVGDLFLDRYLEIEPRVREISIETDLEAYQITRVRNAPGALGTVMNNLTALGVGLLVPVTVIGDDGHGFDLLREVRRLPVDISHVLCDGQRLTPTYTKPLKQDNEGAWRELNRLDFRTRGPLAPEVTQLVCDRLRAAWNSSDGLIVLDQINEPNWGVINDDVRACLRSLAREQPNKVMFIDSRQQLAQFDFSAVKGNRRELTRAAGLSEERDDLAMKAIQQLSHRSQRPAFCTLGEQGIAVAGPEKQAQLIPGFRVDGPIDICGAGDSATSGIVTALLAGATEVEAAAVGNLVASITVQQIGTTGTASPAQIAARWREWHARLA